MELLHMPSKRGEVCRPADSLRGNEPPSIPSTASFGMLREFLATSLGLTNVEAKNVPQGYRSKDEVLATYRFILLIEGSMNYRLDGGVLQLTAGMQVLVPAWTRQRWTVPKAGGCSMLWVEFAAEEVAEEPDGPLVAKIANSALAESALRRMLARWTYGRLPYETRGCAVGASTQVPEQDRIELEAELKATIARFWRQACPVTRGLARFAPGERHPVVTWALRWLRANYARSDALDAFYRELEGNPTHFRVLFRRDAGSTIQGQLARLRLQRARFLLRHTHWPLKRISHEVGFQDAAYFSRHYKAFWGHAPKAATRGYG